jgi:hypothetical protein
MPSAGIATPLRALDGLAHPHQAIGDGVFGVQAEMDETRVGHGGATKKQGAILTLREPSQKTKRQPKLPCLLSSESGWVQRTTTHPATSQTTAAWAAPTLPSRHA